MTVVLRTSSSIDPLLFGCLLHTSYNLTASIVVQFLKTVKAVTWIVNRLVIYAECSMTVNTRKLKLLISS